MTQETKKTHLEVEDIRDFVINLYNLQNCLYEKQIKILIRKSEKIGFSKFWEVFVEKYGVPNIGERGFSAPPEAFAKYYIEDIISELKKNRKNCFDVEKIQSQIDFLNKNPHLQISTEGKSNTEILELYKKHFPSI